MELVPATCWYSNVRSEVTRREWDQIRRKVCEGAGNRCEVCGQPPSRRALDCHEVWEYDDAAGVQRLVRMIALCTRCHEVKHIGLAEIRGRLAAAKAHLSALNGWTEPDTDLYLKGVWEVWERRSRREWTLDLTGLQPYLKEAG